MNKSKNIYSWIITCTSFPLVFTKQEPEVESESAPPIVKTEPDIALLEIPEKSLNKAKMDLSINESPHCKQMNV